jgi:lipopolysaccharide/colanic/teichoic acid biosynthesis glycosyltransferase
MLKRLVDIIMSSIGLLLLAPVLIVCAVIIKFTSSGPVFYRGERVGLNGNIFRTFKFRSMVVDAEDRGGSSTHEADARITGMGAFLRKFKLDELPQLLNVLVGDMSFVGPRPEVKKFVDMYTPEEKIILTVRPGITDWSSIKFHNEGEIIAASGIADADEAYARLIRPEKLRLQMKYVKEHNLWVDINIIFDTLATLFRTRTPLKL